MRRPRPWFGGGSQKKRTENRGNEKASLSSFLPAAKAAFTELRRPKAFKISLFVGAALLNPGRIEAENGQEKEIAFRGPYRVRKVGYQGYVHVRLSRKTMRTLIKITVHLQQSGKGTTDRQLFPPLIQPPLPLSLPFLFFAAPPFFSSDVQHLPSLTVRSHPGIKENIGGGAF